MNNLGFVASLIGSLAWPLALVIILVIFRRPVTKLIGRATQYKGFGQEVTFGDELADVERKIERIKVGGLEPQWQGEPEQRAAGRGQDSVELPASLTEAGLQEAEGEMVRKAEMYPSQVVLEAWDWLNKIVNGDNPAGQEVADEDLWQFVPVRFYRTVKDLLDLRNKVAHGEHTPTPGEAITYIRSCVQIARFFMESGGSRKG